MFTVSVLTPDQQYLFLKSLCFFRLPLGFLLDTLDFFVDFSELHPLHQQTGEKKSMKLTLHDVFQ